MRGALIVHCGEDPLDAEPLVDLTDGHDRLVELRQRRQARLLGLKRNQDAVGGGFNGKQAYDGLLDEISVYDYVRTAKEVEQSYLNGAAKIEDDF